MTTEELEKALFQIQIPGADSIPVAVYKNLWKVIFLHILHTLRDAWKTGFLPESMFEAIIVTKKKILIYWTHIIPYPC